MERNASGVNTKPWNVYKIKIKIEQLDACSAVWSEIDDEQSKKWLQTMQLIRVLKRAWSTSVVAGLQLAQDQVDLKKHVCLRHNRRCDKLTIHKTGRELLFCAAQWSIMCSKEPE